ncbi:hypothetical protein O181_074482 [Austropuccinia psidii MF-1]|uniref:Uncharacterized protein n=1 Tax=Austropuccinia psidii MF-1 TaxID=1389203 RepID=A0A9Q3FD46_9BASI|nr:hypothetical protein [Austropuccinia psidii MF-1]
MSHGYFTERNNPYQHNSQSLGDYTVWCKPEFFHAHAHQKIGLNTSGTSSLPFTMLTLMLKLTPALLDDHLQNLPFSCTQENCLTQLWLIISTINHAYAHAQIYFFTDC